MDTRRAQTTEPTKGSQRMKQLAQGLRGSVPGPLHMLWLVAWSYYAYITFLSMCQKASSQD